MITNGVALLNNRAIPFDMAARDLAAEVHYIVLTDRYGMTVDLKDLRTKIAKQVEASSTLHLAGELGRDAAELKQFEFTSGKSSKLEATAGIKDFAKPQWQMTVKGSVELKQISVLADVDGLNAGAIDLDLKGHNCATSAAVAQKHPPFWRRSHPQETTKPPVRCHRTLIALRDICWWERRSFVKRRIETNMFGCMMWMESATLHVTPTELLLTAMTGYLPGGGSAAGELRIANWLGEVPSTDVAASSATTKAAVTTTNTTAKPIGAKPPISER